MKYEFSFTEASKIFAQVSKIENAVSEQTKLSAEYDSISNTFDAEFAKYNYTFFNAPKELQELFEEKTAIYDANEKAERKAYKAIKEFAELVGVGENYCDCWEDDIKKYLKNRYYWEAPKMVYKCKSLAKDVARKININA